MYQYTYDATGICKYTINNNINNNILDNKYLYTIEGNYNNVSNIENFKLGNVFKDIKKGFEKIEKPIEKAIVNNSIVKTSTNLAVSSIKLGEDIAKGKSLKTIESDAKTVGENTFSFAKVAVPIIGSSTQLIDDIKNKKSAGQIAKDFANVGIDGVVMAAPGGAGIVGNIANKAIKTGVRQGLHTAVKRW